MTHPAYIREKARQMRVEKDLTIDEIAERLAISRQTIFHWVRDLPMTRPRRLGTPAQRARDETNSLRYKQLRDDAYARGVDEYDDLVVEPTFRDFVCMYIGEGYKRSRNSVQLCNSDPDVVVLAKYWICRLAERRVSYALQYHADQDVGELRAFWGRRLSVDARAIAVQRKSNSNQLAGRMWRSRWGVLAVLSHDTYLRARLQAWMDRIHEEWLDLTARGA